MKLIILTSILLVLACGHKVDPLITGPEYEQYIPKPVVEYVIVGQDTIYQGNQ